VASAGKAFPLRAGVRQGSTLWTIYIEKLLVDLTEDAVGYQMSGSRGVFAFADDMTLISPTLAGLKRMFAKCEQYFVSHQILLNRSKSVYVIAGSRRHNRGNAPKADLLIRGELLQPTLSTVFLGFELFVCANGSVIVDVSRTVRKLFSAANALLSIPRCPRPLLLSRLLSTYALAHADYLWQALDHLRPHGVRLVSSAVCQVLRRALGLHFRSSSDLACAAAKVVPPRFRASQLRVACSHHTARNGARSRIRELREAGTASWSAAWIAWLEEAPDGTLHRAFALRALLKRPDCFARAMARNISWPSALR